jgi:hypothetical protein
MHLGQKVMTLVHDECGHQVYSGCRMSDRRSSASWLSEDMACALAAMCPPLRTVDVLRAADKLSEHADAREIVVVDSMFRPGVDRVNLRNLLEALRALHDMGCESLAQQSILSLATTVRCASNMARAGETGSPSWVGCDARDL